MSHGPAKAIEARSDETQSGSAVGESAVALAIRPRLVDLSKTIALNALAYAGRGSMEGETA